MNIVALTGAGISAESGIRTFRDSDGLWEHYRIEDVATPEAWLQNPALVLDFYNQRRQQVVAAQPNPAHLALARLQEHFRVDVVTQNIDNLHERAGSRHVLHLHGEILKARSTLPPFETFTLEGTELNLGDLCPRGSQLRPHIVWFGEEVPMLGDSARLVQKADILLIVGTSLNVYPAAGLVNYAPPHCRIYVIDPNAPEVYRNNVTILCQKAGDALPILVDQLIVSK